VGGLAFKVAPFPSRVRGPREIFFALKKIGGWAPPFPRALKFLSSLGFQLRCPRFPVRGKVLKKGPAGRAGGEKGP